MVRGRKRDVSAPLTRSLVLQRDYRARKARYVTELESRCQKLENDNGRLSKEVEELKAQLLQKELDRQETLASLTTEAELEKAHALNNVMFTLSSAAASIKSFQALTMGPNHSPVEDPPLERKPSLSSKRSTRPSPSSSSSSPLSDFSSYTDAVPLPNSDIRPLQLYSPISNCSRARSVSLSDSWNELSPSILAQGLPQGQGDAEMEVPRAAALSQSHHHHDVRSSTSSYTPPQGRCSQVGPLLLDFSQSLSIPPPLPPPLLPRTLSSSFEDGPRGISNFKNGRSASSSSSSAAAHHHIPTYDRIHGSTTGQMIPYSNEFISQGIPPSASYERTLSQSLRNWT
ncbi:hypothetical protein D9757_009465 [Collybiopsis confluens]|uniref:BZIP domain-containing protein n=1 Tax=Collybiopsis confluens TaxID=2823264 RepID=A0A8H5H4Z4_9AGAR|nr:hypothetical protein D9757_009465 [Collybiopsis confluens]